MMKNYDQSVEMYHNPNWSFIPDDHYRNLIIGDSGSRKTNVLLNLNKRSTTRYWKHLFIGQRSIPIKVSIAY